MKILSIVLLLILFLGLVSYLVNFISIPYLIESPLIPKSLISTLQKEALENLVFEFVFFTVSVYFAIKKRYKISMIVSLTYILLYLISVYLNTPFI